MLLHFRTPSSLLMIHYEETRLNSNYNSNTNPMVRNYNSAQTRRSILKQYITSQSTKSPFLVPIPDGLQSPGTNRHKSISVKARIAFVQFSNRPFLSLSTDLIHQRQISESVQKYTSSIFTIILLALFTESTSLLIKWQSSNSSRGMVNVLCGADFVFGDKKRTKHISLVTTFK